jgi:hypothetical protein
MTHARWAVAAALALASAGQAMAQGTPATPGVLTTAVLTEHCASAPSNDEAAGTIFCRGFMLGAGQYHSAISAARGGARLYCLPDGLTLRDVQTAFVGWSRANPQHQQDTAVDGLMRFAATTWPCPATAPARRGNR